MNEVSLSSAVSPEGGENPGSVFGAIFNTASDVICSIGSKGEVLAVGVLGTLGALAIRPLTHGSDSFIEMPSVQKVKAAAYTGLSLSSAFIGLGFAINQSKLEDRVFSPGIALGAIGFLGFAILSSKTHDLEDPSELHAEKKAARSSTWSRLISRFSIDEIDKLLTPEEVKQKFEVYEAAVQKPVPPPTTVYVR